MRYAEDVMDHGFERVVMNKDWENFSGSAKAKSGAIDYVICDMSGVLSIIFHKTDTINIKSNDLGQLVCHGIPRLSVSTI